MSNATHRISSTLVLEMQGTMSDCFDLLHHLSSMHYPDVFRTSTFQHNGSLFGAYTRHAEEILCRSPYSVVTLRLKLGMDGDPLHFLKTIVLMKKTGCFDNENKTYACQP